MKKRPAVAANTSHFACSSPNVARATFGDDTILVKSCQNFRTLSGGGIFCGAGIKNAPKGG